MTRPAYWDTGIKDKDGVNHYKCHYWCECGHKGKRYIALEAEFVACHECGYHLDVEPVGKPGKRDRFGNYFVARSAV